MAAELEFDASLAAFQAALDSGTLTPAELIQLLSERALVLHALRRKDELLQDFLWLSALAPDYRLDLRAPPDLTATWTSVRDQGRGVLRVELQAQTGGDGRIDARASLTGTVPEGARPRLWLRRGRTRSFELLSVPEFSERADGSEPLSFYADGLVLGGVVIPGEHTAQNPLQVRTRSPAKEDNDERGWASRHKGWLIGGASMVAAAIVVTAVLVARSSAGHSDKTNIKPMVTF